MSRPRRPKSPSKMDARAKHLRVYRFMFESPAYRSLLSVARCLLHELMYRFNGQNNGYVAFSHREALDEIGTRSNRAVTDAFKELQSKGFIRPRVIGSFNLKRRHATEWILTHEEYGGREATKDFMRWRPTGEKTRGMQIARRRGAICTPSSPSALPKGPKNDPYGMQSARRQ